MKASKFSGGRGKNKRGGKDSGSRLRGVFYNKERDEGGEAG